MKIISSNRNDNIGHEELRYIHLKRSCSNNRNDTIFKEMVTVKSLVTSMCMSGEVKERQFNNKCLLWSSGRTVTTSKTSIQ